MRILPTLPCLLALCLPACGGGGGSDPGGAALGAQLKGNVVAVNGQSADVTGVSLRVRSTGTSDVSDDDGSFDLGNVAPGTQVVEVRTRGGAGLEIEIEVEDDGVVRLRVSVDDDGVGCVNEDHCEGDGGRTESRTGLTAFEAGLAGHVRLRKDDDGDQGFDVEAEHLAPGRQVDVVVLDPTDGAEATLARLTADATGEAELELRTSDGDALPFAVADVAELADLVVEVRDAGTGALLLAGIIPSIGSMPACGGSGGSDDDSDDDDSGDDDSDDDRDGDRDSDDGDDDRAGEARLVNQGLVPGTGKVQLRSRPSRGEEKLEVQVIGGSGLGTLQAWLEDPATPGTLVQIGVLQPNEDGLELERDTRDGDTLPFGLPSASDLVGLAVEVRRASDGAVLFAGTTPPVRVD